MSSSESASSSCSDDSFISSEDEEQVDSEDEDVQIPEVIDLKLSAAGVSAIKFHPKDAQLACGTTDGRLRVYVIDTVISAPCLRGTYHKSIRDIAYTEDGNRIISVSSLGAFKCHDTKSGQLTAQCLQAHNCGINKVVSLNPDQFVTGDENGFVKLFDMRRLPEPLFSLHCQSDWHPPGAEALSSAQGLVSGLCGISDIATLPGHLLASCEDGTLLHISLNKRKVKLKSEFFGYPLTSVLNMKLGSKFLVSSEEGACLTFNKDEFGNLCDRFAVSKKSVESMCKVTEDVAVCALGSGALEAVSLLPNSSLGLVGTQPTVAGFCLRVACDRTAEILASCSPDNATVCLWSCGRFSDDFSKLSEAQSLKRKNKMTNATLVQMKKAKPGHTDFFNGLSEIQEEDGDSNYS